MNEKYSDDLLAADHAEIDLYMRAVTSLKREDQKRIYELEKQLEGITTSFSWQLLEPLRRVRLRISKFSSRNDLGSDDGA